MKILDCTLRDGGFRSNFNWDLDFAKRYYQLMTRFNIAYIELGYWKQTAKSKNPFYNFNYETLKYITKGINKPNVSVIIDYHYCSKNLNDYPKKFQTNISMIRLTSRKADINKALNFAKKLKNKTKLDTSFQLINITNYSKNELIKTVRSAINCGLYYLYFADSHGHLNLLEDYNKLSDSINLLRENNIKIGFHLHNHSNRALMNYYVCKKNNINMIDTSFLGMGKGGGNLRFENVIINECLVELLEFIEKEKKNLVESYDDRYLYDIITGRLSLTDNYATHACKKKMNLSDFYNKCLAIRGVNKDKFNENLF